LTLKFSSDLLYIGLELSLFLFQSKILIFEDLKLIRTLVSVVRNFVVFLRLVMLLEMLYLNKVRYIKMPLTSSDVGLVLLVAVAEVFLVLHVLDFLHSLLLSCLVAVAITVKATRCSAGRNTRRVEFSLVNRRQLATLGLNSVLSLHVHTVCGFLDKL
jgi:hypothetical protein